MTTTENCAFCDREGLELRTIRADKLFISFVSRPWFRKGHCLVVPGRHLTEVVELTTEEGGAIFTELGRLATALDKGFGSGVMQKYQPQQAENGIKVSHLHFHVFPRVENEEGLFPAPNPNSFDGFVTPTDQEVIALTTNLR